MRTRRTFLALTATAVVAGCQGDRNESSNRTGRPPATGSPNSESPDSDGAEYRDRVAWRQSLPGTVAHRPALDGGSVYATAESGVVVALDAGDGHTQWTAETDPVIREPPVAGDGTVLAVAAAEGTFENDTLYALDADGGAQRWTFSPTNYFLDVLGTDGDTVYVGTNDDALGPDGETLYALDIADGSERWSVEIGDPSHSLVTDERLYVVAPGVVQAVDTDGTPAWEFELAPYWQASPSVANGTVALAVTGDSGDEIVVGLDAGTGEESWTFEAWRAETVQSVGDRLLVGGDALASLDPRTGEIRWQTDASVPVDDAVAADGTLYAVGDEAVAVTLADGDVAWRASVDVSRDGGTDEPVFEASPTGLVDGELVIQRSLTRDDQFRHLLAVDTATGDRAWAFTGESELTRLTVGESSAYVGEGESVLALDS